MWLFAAFLAVPIIEIALFIQVGGLIGLWPTLAIVVLTAVLGTYLVRSQGVQALNNVRRSFSDLNDPTEPLAHGAMILVAGVLLLTPGFFTDAVGFALLTPPVRAAVFNYLRKNIKVQRFEMGRGPGPQRPQGHRRPGGRGDVIDGDYEDVTAAEDVLPPKQPTHPGSGWTKH
ncbi:FxsA family protein [Puniceibacterium confluentis]|uniref:FxsA family protein n=1 Tax=Puniceibacterium confluentis TaxID=1958944 RepID=UPI003561C944